MILSLFSELFVPTPGAGKGHLPFRWMRRLVRFSRLTGAGIWNPHKALCLTVTTYGHEDRLLRFDEDLRFRLRLQLDHVDQIFATGW